MTFSPCFYLVVPVHGGEVALANTNTSHIEAGAEGEGGEDQDRAEDLPHHDAGLDVSLPSLCLLHIAALFVLQLEFQVYYTKKLEFRKISISLPINFPFTWQTFYLETSD